MTRLLNRNPMMKTRAKDLRAKRLFFLFQRLVGLTQQPRFCSASSASYVAGRSSVAVEERSVSAHPKKF